MLGSVVIDPEGNRTTYIQTIDALDNAAVGFDGSALDGTYYSGESLDEGGTSDVYEIDPQTNKAELRFSMKGYFYGLYQLDR